ncbi:enoyl-CoA hydratase/isomerase family protein [Streptomyces sp. NPDC102259]|uniref:enoyl-CoA hydratase/isomerase family protein n=1 Tax=Streptomyces sp. NPDC102259 TaxID=3366148 RepID=UPI003816BF62
MITIAKVRGRARGGGNELALACDMTFASRENAVFGQFECGTGALPGAGGIQHLTRRLGRTRAIEALAGADDFDADLAERYGWINRALPDVELDGFVERIAKRIAGFPPKGIQAAKRAINDLTLAKPADIRSDAATFQGLITLPETRERLDYLADRGLQRMGRSNGIWARPCRSTAVDMASRPAGCPYMADVPEVPVLPVAAADE